MLYRGALKEVKKADKPDVQKDSDKKKPGVRGSNNVPLFGPLFLWIGLVALGAIVQLLLFPLASGIFVTHYMVDLNLISNYILWIPGIFILPMVVALWIGSRVGYTQGTYGELTYRSILNSLYAAVVYVISIFMVYIASTSLRAGVLSTVPFNTFIEYVVLVPVGIVVVVVPLFAILTYAKRY